MYVFEIHPSSNLNEENKTKTISNYLSKLEVNNSNIFISLKIWKNAKNSA